MTLNQIAIFNHENNETFANMILTEKAENLHTVFMLATRGIRFGKYSRMAILSKFRHDRKRLRNIVMGNDKQYPIVDFKRLSYFCVIGNTRCSTRTTVVRETRPT